MKIIAFISTLVILFLSTMPCMDAPSVRHESSVFAEQGSQDHPDACSPFCVCSCCAGGAHYFVTGAASVTAPLPESTARFSVIHISLGMAVPLPVWQPPQQQA